MTPGHCRRRKALQLALALVMALVMALASAAGLVPDAGPAWAEDQSAPAPKAQTGGESMSARLGRLEDQFVDLQVMVGTLESLLRSRPGARLPQETPSAAPRFVTESDVGQRVDAIETQIKALTSQLERMALQIDAIDAKLSAAPQPLAPPRAPNSETPERHGATPSAPDTATASAEGAPEETGFGTLSIEAGSDDEAENPDAPQSLLRAGDGMDDADQDEEEPESVLAALPPSGDARSLYEEGYVQLMRSDYTAAEAAFQALLDQYPRDPLAGDAQYWLGETYYSRGEYKDAAGAFLKGYKSYGSSRKAPDSLLKLGMALAQLGQKDEACSTFDELEQKFPQAPGYIFDTAKSEGRKLGC